MLQALFELFILFLIFTCTVEQKEIDAIKKKLEDERNNTSKKG